MRVKSYLKFLIGTAIIILASGFSVFAAQLEGAAVSGASDDLEEIQKQAKDYRAGGLEAQRMGNYEMALSLYQKAVYMDPDYADVYNDMGIIFEVQGETDRALESYYRAIKADPLCKDAYTNLALLYENKRDLVNAAACWQKRSELGELNDFWTQKAIARLKDIKMTTSDEPLQEAKEQNVLALMKDMSEYKEELGKDDLALAKDYFQKAKNSFKAGDLARAIKEALDAQYLDPDNSEIEKFIEKVQTRALAI
ncbi:MAG: tetratricopeptide repeat protein [Candidatus Omnitrophica bacterium]|jgi:Flp pilus assembly protein TadD|nr:tetratricopeptide repeat protein [Candidatus Omnitrophota bacterium]